MQPISTLPSSSLSTLGAKPLTGNEPIVGIVPSPLAYGQAAVPFISPGLNHFYNRFDQPAVTIQVQSPQHMFAPYGQPIMSYPMNAMSMYPNVPYMAPMYPGYGYPPLMGGIPPLMQQHIPQPPDPQPAAPPSPEIKGPAPAGQQLAMPAAGSTQPSYPIFPGLEPPRSNLIVPSQHTSLINQQEQYLSPPAQPVMPSNPGTSHLHSSIGPTDLEPSKTLNMTPAFNGYPQQGVS